MGIVERREREREEVRRKILDAARELFTSEGYEKVTMRRIAEAIEYSPTAIYHHFADKEALVEALCYEDFARLLHVFEERPLPSDPIAAIRQLGLAYARFGLAHPNHYRFMFLTRAEHYRPHQDGTDPGQQSFFVLREVAGRAIAAGLFRPIGAEAAAQVLWASLHGAVALMITYRPDQFPGEQALADLVEQVMENSLRGLLAGEKS